MKKFSSHFKRETQLDEARAMRPDRMSSSDMFLQAFIDKLKKTKKLPILTFNQNFTNTKVARGTMANKSSTQRYLSTRKGGDPFDKFSKGSSAKSVLKQLPVKNIPQIVKQVEQAMSELDPAVGKGKDVQKANAILTKIKVETTEGRFTFFDIDESSFRVKGNMPGGQSEAFTNQALQCITSACMANGIWPLSKNYKQIARYVKIGDFNVEEILKSRDDPRFRNKSNNWVVGSVSTHKALEKKYGSLKGYKFINENDRIHKEIYDHALKLLQEEDPTFSGKYVERWNPADIWIVSDYSVMNKLKTTKTLSQLNKMMLNMYPKDLIPVSMKKPGKSASIKVRNNEKDVEGLTMLEFDPEPKSTMKNSWFGTKGTHEYKATNAAASIQVASYSGHLSCFQLNEGTGSVSDGAMVGSTTVKIMREYGVIIPSNNEIKSRFQEGYLTGSQSQFWRDFARMYDKYDPDKVSARALREQAYAVLPPEEAKSGGAVLHTYNNLIMMEAIDNVGGASKVNRALQGIYKFVSSMTPLSSVHIVVGADNSTTEAADNSKKETQINPGVIKGKLTPERFAATQKEIQAVKDKYGDEDLDGEALKQIKRIRMASR
jgi:hypothetical protein